MSRKIVKLLSFGILVYILLDILYVYTGKQRAYLFYYLHKNDRRLEKFIGNSIYPLRRDGYEISYEVRIKDYNISNYKNLKFYEGDSIYKKIAKMENMKFIEYKKKYHLVYKSYKQLGLLAVYGNFTKEGYVEIVFTSRDILLWVYNPLLFDLNKYKNIFGVYNCKFDKLDSNWYYYQLPKNGGYDFGG